MTDPRWRRVAEAVKARRLLLGYSQRDAANLAKVSPTTWVSLEAHARPVSELTRSRVTMALLWPSDAIDLLLTGDAEVGDFDVPLRNDPILEPGPMTWAEIGEWLRRWRSENHGQIAYLALRASVTPAQWRHLEEGDPTDVEWTPQLIASALGWDDVESTPLPFFWPPLPNDDPSAAERRLDRLDQELKDATARLSTLLSELRRGVLEASNKIRHPPGSVDLTELASADPVAYEEVVAFAEEKLEVLRLRREFEERLTDMFESGEIIITRDEDEPADRQGDEGA